MNPFLWHHHHHYDHQEKNKKIGAMKWDDGLETTARIQNGEEILNGVLPTTPKGMEWMDGIIGMQSSSHDDHSN